MPAILRCKPLGPVFHPLPLSSSSEESLLRGGVPPRAVVLLEGGHVPNILPLDLSGVPPVLPVHVGDSSLLPHHLVHLRPHLWDLPRLDGPISGVHVLGHVFHHLLGHLLHSSHDGNDHLLVHRDLPVLHHGHLFDSLDLLHLHHWDLRQLLDGHLLVVRLWDLHWYWLIDVLDLGDLHDGVHGDLAVLNAVIIFDFFHVLNLGNLNDPLLNFWTRNGNHSVLNHHLGNLHNSLHLPNLLPLDHMLMVFNLRDVNPPLYDLAPSPLDRDRAFLDHHRRDLHNLLHDHCVSHATGSNSYVLPRCLIPIDLSGSTTKRSGGRRGGTVEDTRADGLGPGGGLRGQTDPSHGPNPPGGRHFGVEKAHPL
mmetsp:Transcript_73076/g.167588  ORF Transcript_73076/g.167588 Transcript_73076/m.167588 type:complete len:365 (+) Transcript_73076:56-1150(+)